MFKFFRRIGYCFQLSWLEDSVNVTVLIFDVKLSSGFFSFFNVILVCMYLISKGVNKFIIIIIIIILIYSNTKSQTHYINNIFLSQDIYYT